MASSSEPDLSKVGNKDAEASLQHSPSAPQVNTPDKPTSDDAPKAHKVEQMQIEEPRHGSSHGETEAKRKYLYIGVAVLVFIVIITLIAVALSGKRKRNLPAHLAVYPVLPDDPDWISPENKTDEVKPEESYLNEILAKYPYLSKSCGLIYRNLTAGQSLAYSENQRILHANQNEVLPGQVPWQLEMFETSSDDLVLDDEPYCGASLISAHFALTAAHCVPAGGDLTVIDLNIWVISSFVLLTQLRKEGWESADLKRKVIKAMPHPEWTGPSSNNLKRGKPDSEGDIAIISWKKPFKRIHTRDGLVVLSPVCLPSFELIETYNQSYVGRHNVSGLGAVGENSHGIEQDRIRYTTFNYPEAQEYEKCATSYSKKNYTEAHICFCRERHSSGPQTCVADSGGPLVSDNLDPSSLKRRQFLTGIVSFGRRKEGVPKTDSDCQDRRMAGFTRVLYFMDWVNKTMSENVPSGGWQDIY